ncbi:coiled-coil domain-containing protein 78-like [Gigantopelta aegis]|uniref:coiled-coil domain-containing protein 78-like n=1 Tax=Gigantopelta aegis TaxID=1735272 RepID=UPI001B888EDE|nr:coiled-coil domain-containing protein 78-like [Gigantopelta aegis]XP_041358709.1 coiled-coil domain-containing protein 78-like [Gigantopelta aegis]
MNIEVVGRIRPSIVGEGSQNLNIEGSQRVSALTGHFFNFKILHQQNADTYEVFHESAEFLLDMFMSGINVCLLITGESGSGKSYTMGGEGVVKAGIVHMIFDYLFAKLMEGRYMSQTRGNHQNPRVSLQMFEVYNEMVKNLLEVPRGHLAYGDITETVDNGIHVKNSSPTVIKDAQTANSLFRAAWGRRTEATTDFGPAQHNAAILLNIDLSLKVGESPTPSKCRFTVVELPGLEKLAEDPERIRQKEGASLSRGLTSLNRVVTSLSSNPFPDRVINYGDSRLTQLLREELGGNCKTRAIVCLKPHTEPEILAEVLKFSTSLSLVNNFPIVNDIFAQGLLIQHRAKTIDLQHQLGIGPTTMAASSVASHLGNAHEEIKRLQTENLVLKDQNERLQIRLDSIQNKFSTLSNTKTDLSQQLLLSEEEKLKISQSLVEMQIDNNKIREEAEATKFELTNKIIMTENSLMEAEAEKEKAQKAMKGCQERLTEMERDRKELADEYVVLKTNYLALTNEHKKELNRNEELCMELLNLVNAKATLMRQVLILTNGDPKIGDPSAEISRIKAIVTKYSSGKVKVDQIVANQKDRDNVEEALFANRRRHESELERIRLEYGDQSSRYENRLTGLIKELQDCRNISRDRQHKISELNAKLITLRGEREQLTTQLNRLQHKVKDLGEDFRTRLVKYVEDISDFVDKGSGVPGQPQETRMREYIDSMLKDIRRSHREREEQLSQAAQCFKKRLQTMVHDYEALIIAYRNLRQTCEARGMTDIDLGPDEYTLKLSDSELSSSHLKEVSRLNAELARTRGDVDSIKLRYGLFGDKADFTDPRLGDKADSWGYLRKQMREFTLNTQQHLEDERAQLLSENQMLREQLRESQEYIDSHLARYKQEITRLRKLLGLQQEELILTERQVLKNRTRRQ